MHALHAMGGLTSSYLVRLSVCILLALPLLAKDNAEGTTLPTVKERCQSALEVNITYGQASVCSLGDNEDDRASPETWIVTSQSRLSKFLKSDDPAGSSVVVKCSEDDDSFTDKTTTMTTTPALVMPFSLEAIVKNETVTVGKGLCVDVNIYMAEGVTADCEIQHNGTREESQTWVATPEKSTFSKSLTYIDSGTYTISAKCSSSDKQYTDQFEIEAIESTPGDEPFSVKLKMSKDNIFADENVCVCVESSHNVSTACLLDHEGANQSADTWFVMSGSLTYNKSLTYNIPGKYSLTINCTSKDKRVSTDQITIEVHEVTTQATSEATATTAQAGTAAAEVREPFSVKVQLSTDQITVGDYLAVEMEMFGHQTVTCTVENEAANEPSPTRFVTTNSTVFRSFSYNTTGTYSLVVNCSNSDNSVSIQRRNIEVIEVIFDIKTHMDSDYTVVGEETCLHVSVNGSEGKPYVCLLDHRGNIASHESWVVTSDSSLSKSLTYNEAGVKHVTVNCSRFDDQVSIEERTIYSIIPMTKITLNETIENGSALLASESGVAQVKFTLDGSGPYTPTATLDGVPVRQDFVMVDETARTGYVIVTSPGALVLNVDNKVSSSSVSLNFTMEDKVSRMILDTPEYLLVNTTYLLKGTSQGQNVLYKFCFKEPVNDQSNSTNCISTGSYAYLNYTFSTTGLTPITLVGQNSVNELNITSEIDVVNPVKGFRFTASQLTASTTDEIQFDLHAPAANHFPMGQLMTAYMKDGTVFGQPGMLSVNPGGIHSINKALSPPGIITVSVLVASAASSQTLSVDIRVGDPINAQMASSGEYWRSDKPLLVTIFNMTGWGFDSVLQYGDGYFEQSSTNVLNTTFGDSTVFSHTYTQADEFTIVYEASNAVHKKTLRQKVTILHPVLAFNIKSAPAISIPDGWATFEILPTVEGPTPTDATCSIDYGDNSTLVRKADWATSFPASHNYKDFGTFIVKISCENIVSEFASDFQVIVQDRDIDIRGLHVTIPKYSLVSSPTDLEISIEDGSRIRYKVRIGDDDEIGVLDKPNDKQWTMSHTFANTGETDVLVTAENSVSRADASLSVFVIKKLAGFVLNIDPLVASTAGDIDISLLFPNSDRFPFGPLNVQFFKEAELLKSEEVESPVPEETVKITSSRWTAAKYTIKAIITSPLDRMELQQTVIVQTPVPFFIFTVDDIVTIPDGNANYLVETRFDEPVPTDANCAFSFGDGEVTVVSWDYKIHINHTFYTSGFYNCSVSCENAVSERHAAGVVDLCEFTGDGFRFSYPKIVPFNSSSRSVNVRFKYNICGLTTLSSDALVDWQFEPGSPVISSTTLDWEMEHAFTKRGSYNIQVFIKSRQTKTETMVSLPIRIGILIVTSQNLIGKTNEDVFNLTALGAYGSKVHFLADFGSGKNMSVNKTDLDEDDPVVFSKIYKVAGLYRPRVLVWTQTYAEEVIYSRSFIVQSKITKFDISLEQETWTTPIYISFTFHLPSDVAPKDAICLLQTGDGTDYTVEFNRYVHVFYSLRAVHRYRDYGPYDISANCSNAISYSYHSGRIQLRSSSSATIIRWSLPLIIGLLALLRLNY